MHDALPSHRYGAPPLNRYIYTCLDYRLLNGCAASPVSGFHGTVLICLAFHFDFTSSLYALTSGETHVEMNPMTTNSNGPTPESPLCLGKHSTTWDILLFTNWFFSKAAARRHAHFVTVTLGKFKESVVTYFSNKQERGKVPFGFSITFFRHLANRIPWKRASSTKFHVFFCTY